MLTPHSIAVFVMCGATSLSPMLMRAQQQDAHSLVRSVVDNELAADKNDHSRWMFRDANKRSDKSTVTLVVQTPEGDLSKTIEINGHPLTPQQQKADEQNMHRFVTDPSARQKQKRDHAQDAEKARSLTKMLPDAFLWTVTGQSGTDMTLTFKSNPNFHPPTREARVFAAMEGTMVVNTSQKRIETLKGKLTRNVNFGFGMLGKLEKGGSFDVERQQVGPGVWQMTATHIHMQGHALIFKSISEQQDEEISHYTPAPRSITLASAEKMLNDGEVAKRLAVTEPK
jgi:hypothetical protein